MYSWKLYIVVINWLLLQLASVEEGVDKGMLI